MRETSMKTDMKKEIERGSDIQREGAGFEERRYREMRDSRWT